MQEEAQQKYTKPELRNQIKNDLMRSDKGGRSGEWSARKSQLLVQEYERRGGGYKQDQKDEDAKNLQSWTRQDWQTNEGSARADQGSQMKRYLPEKAWDLMSDEEKRRANETKQEGDRDGNQYVQNTPAAEGARAYAEHGDASHLNEGQLKRLNRDELQKVAREEDLDHRSTMNKDQLAENLHDKFQDDPESMTRDQLYEEAKHRGIKGRSKLLKADLVKAVRQARSESSTR
ncbi:Rho termination factor N-terminal domain-containing protein [Roseiconus nitratireducens]|uniref:Rho termination factor N-terminal domain-containing protein n=1 Tax=Roseiconus nitratireducens TaxID=2605748 RepID=UPI00191C0D25|nr:Rho termination factor N-terminal domain-containing protein [Roseiconus nitratireducens]